MAKGKQSPSRVFLTTDVTSTSRRHTSPPNPFQFSVAEDSQQNTGTITGGPSLAARRPRCQSLAPLRILRRRGREFDWREDLRRGEEDVEEGGRQLFNNFVYQQAQTENPDAVRRLHILTPTAYANPRVAMVGRELRDMADRFANTPERRRVREKAAQVNPNITYEEFKELLTELFASGGITRGRIVVLFFFCSDVALRSLSRGSELCCQFLQWSLSFITESVCDWVRSHGGWGEVMKASSLTKSLVVAALGVLVGFGIYKYVNSS